jgi:hypothetical protein
MVVAEVFAKDPAQVSLIEHDDVVQTIPAYGTDDTFDKWILPGRTRRAKVRQNEIGKIVVIGGLAFATPKVPPDRGPTKDTQVVLHPLAAG